MMNKKSIKTRKTTALLVIVSLIFTLLTSIATPQEASKSQAAGYGLSNPTTDANGVTTWDTVYFGNYYQSDATGTTKEKIRWRVLSVNGDDAFLLADQNLDAQPYNTEYTDVTWETCTLRTWLNNTFLSTAFTSAEQAAIKNTTVVNEDNPYYNTEGGNNTTDKVYLLSIAEVCNTSYGFNGEYRQDSETREARNTAYVAGKPYMTSVGEADFWWLRSPGYGSNCAADVSSYGYGYDDGGNVDFDMDGVRPALHLNLSSSNLWSNGGKVTSSGGGGASAETTITNEQYLALSGLAYSNLTPSDGKTISESGKQDKYEKDMAEGNGSKKIANDNLNLTFTEYAAKMVALIQDWKIGKIYENPTSGFYAAALLKGDQCVFAIRGSQNFLKPKNLNDWTDNAKYGLFQLTSKQMTDALYYVKQAKSDYSNFKFSVTGHSLGGGLGIMASNYVGVKARVFDASPTTDVSYYRSYALMSKSFEGIDKWQSVDYMNENCPVGALDKDCKQYIALTDRKTSIFPWEAHERWSILDNVNNTIQLSPQKKSQMFSSSDVIYKGMNRVSATALSDALKASLGDVWGTIIGIGVKGIGPSILQAAFPAGTLVLGNSSSQTLNAKRNQNIIHTDVMYGGAGNDTICSFYGNDYLMGGDGNDKLDGGHGNDTYVYWKGQGVDTINDVAGNDSLLLEGFKDSDEITCDSSGEYDLIKANGETIVKVSKHRSITGVSNSFTVMSGSDTIKLHDWNIWKNAKSLTIACPVTVDIYNPEGTLVQSLSDELDEPIYTDYGCFYVTKDGDEKIKHIEVEGDYEVKIRATDTGSMDVYSYNDNEDGYSVTTAQEVPVSSGEIYEAKQENDLNLIKTYDGEAEVNEKIPLKEDTIIPAQSISANDTINLKVNETNVLKISISPSNTTEQIAYESGDETIASIDSNGKITAHKEGATYVNAYVESGVYKQVKVVVTKNSSPTPTPTSTTPLPKKNTTKTIGALKYKVTKSAAKNGTVAVTGVKSKKAKSLTVPSTVKINGYTFKVIAINIKAFMNCKKLTKLTIKSTYIQSVGKNAIKGTNKKLVIKVPKKRLKKYKKLFNKKTGFTKGKKVKN